MAAADPVTTAATTGAKPVSVDAVSAAAQVAGATVSSRPGARAPRSTATASAPASPHTPIELPPPIGSHPAQPTNSPVRPPAR